MKAILYIIFLFSNFSLIAQGKKFFDGGSVQLQSTVEKLNLQYVADLPFVNVNINGKTYNFLFDTGAPTVISTAIYTELGLEKKHKSKAKDSQRNKQSQIFSILPEMIVDQVTFKNIGVVVMDLKATEFECLQVDGILGANQMAKLFWKVNYAENTMEVTQDLSQFDLNEFDFVIPFTTKNQKTPIVEAQIIGKKIDFTFDTGFSRNLKITDRNYNPKEIVEKVAIFGNSSIGAFGAGNPASGYLFKAPNLSLGNKSFTDEMVTTGGSNLIGNGFFQNFVMVLDWTNRKIYMKQIRNASYEFSSFGFGYRFVENKPVVVYIFQDESLPLQVGDSIISINNVDLEHLDKDAACHYFFNRAEQDADVIDIKIRRSGEVLDVKLTKKVYLKS
ncbi:retropepsin-like aspartic protease [Sphingobacterium paludis]|uniref:Aspartyl protease n=1 Tax=Sphingobacterium paludis TaxID=1476465 RepID=A0A4R7CZA3_9SPHI|nr:retropepsin-like aspartic protease [Sphingobacterium paludis]TDS13929.1 aspartyl protease [Sphingobacterium paludis]